MNFRFPIFLDLTGKKCLVTGEGPEVVGKVRTLLAASAYVVYVNSSAESDIEALAQSGRVVWHQREFEPQDLDGCFLVITDRDDNAEVFSLAEERNVLCNAVDDPEQCRFSFGSVHRQGDLTIAISTNGQAPALAVRLKERLQREIGPEYGALLKLLKEVRPQIARRIPDFAARREVWYKIVDSGVLEKLSAGESDAAIDLIHNLIEEAVSNTSRSDASADDAGR